MIDIIGLPFCESQQAAFIRQRFGQAVQADADRLPHHPAFHAERNESEQSQYRHFKIPELLPSSQEWKVVRPFSQCPVVPEFPEQAADQSTSKGGEGPAVPTVLPIAEHARPAEIIIDWI